ncbi:MAG: BamA/TamA family outer membrane protein [Salinisphaera sp.]|nr:BamA/TamA family outer membrane protein [Salinisphaera sp.]
MRRFYGILWRNAFLGVVGALLLPDLCVYAGPNLDGDRSIGQMIVIDNERRALGQSQARAPSVALPRPGEAEPPQEVSTSSNVAVLPQLGYDPAAGFIVGAKFSDIGFGPSDMNLDVGATQSTDGETEFDLALGAPHLFGTDFIGLVQLGYHLTPSMNFYGLGNNSVGDTALTRHEEHGTSALFTLGRRLAPHWVLAGSIGYERITIGSGKPDGLPITTHTFPELPGLSGGYNNPLSLSLIYNTRHDLTRPARGWNVIAKVQHIGPELGNRFRYTRYTADASYLHPVVSPDHLIGIRIDGVYVDGRGDNLPFYEFATIGGINKLEGFNPNRFLGQARLFGQVGYQTLLADFDFYHIWRVRLDGAIFAGAGRVFLDRSKLPDALLQSEPQIAPGLGDRIQYSYGTGLHIALGEALAARLDAGFSRESQGLIYLSFGNAF